MVFSIHNLQIVSSSSIRTYSYYSSHTQLNLPAQQRSCIENSSHIPFHKYRKQRRITSGYSQAPLPCPSLTPSQSTNKQRSLPAGHASYRNESQRSPKSQARANPQTPGHDHVRCPSLDDEKNRNREGKITCKNRRMHERRHVMCGLEPSSRA
jgi:hypothetical protein